jgi:DnaJ-class molecular chaperone
MTLAEGEYEFTCTECKGDGNLQYLLLDEDADADHPDEPQFVWDKCDECRGDGTVTVDEEEAAEWIEAGQVPLRAPK